MPPGPPHRVTIIQITVVKTSVGGVKFQKQAISLRTKPVQIRQIPITNHRKASRKQDDADKERT